MVEVGVWFCLLLGLLLIVGLCYVGYGALNNVDCCFIGCVVFLGLLVAFGYDVVGGWWLV